MKGTGIMRHIDPATMVDLQRYPIEDIGSPSEAAFTKKCHAEFVETGLCRLPGFIKAEALEILAKEANGLSSQAYFCKSTHNAYLDGPEDASGNSAAQQHQEDTFVGSVAYDLIPESAALKQLYQWDPLRDFIGGVLGKPVLYRFADPMGACSINVFSDGGEHGWHFDESEFTITLMLQAPERGGSFEYVPKIRGLKDEEQIVARVLEGERDGVAELPFSAGTLLIFGGSQTLHRVTKVHGNRPRLVPVLCFSEKPGSTNSPAVRKMFWGRSGEEMTA